MRSVRSNEIRGRANENVSCKRALIFSLTSLLCCFFFFFLLAIPSSVECNKRFAQHFPLWASRSSFGLSNFRRINKQMHIHHISHTVALKFKRERKEAREQKKKSATKNKYAAASMSIARTKMQINKSNNNKGHPIEIVKTYSNSKSEQRFSAAFFFLSTEIDCCCCRNRLHVNRKLVLFAHWANWTLAHENSSG